MKKPKLKIVLLLLTLAFIARQFYTLSNPYIKQHNWLHGGVVGLGDSLNFEGADIKDNTIFVNGKPTAIILRRGYRPIIPNYLVVKSIQTGEIGTYHEK